METRFKEEERVQICRSSTPFEGKTGTIIAVVPSEDSCDYWVRIDSGGNVQVSERELSLLGN